MSSGFRIEHLLGQRLRWAPLLVWGLAWTAMAALDERMDLANKALVVVLGAALTGLWWGARASLLAGVVAVLAFNVAFVPPRGTLSVDLRQHLLLLVATLGVSGTVAWLMARLRQLALDANLHAERSDQLRAMGDLLRASDDPAEQLPALQAWLAGMGAADVLVLLRLAAEAPGRHTERLLGAASADEAMGLRLCAQDGRAMGPFTARHAEQRGWYLPLRGRVASQGAVLVRHGEGAQLSVDSLQHAQALCDQMGQALERWQALRLAATAREQAQGQALRNTLLAAIAHDHRTPLATILGAASSLHDQDERLSAPQRRQLAATIIDEAGQLSRLTENTLQLARLEAVGLDVQKDWESSEEIVGTVMRRLRQRGAPARLRPRLEPALPLLRCDAVLLVQMLDNLIDNAFKHAPESTAVDLLVRREGPMLCLAVCDRGPGIDAALQAQLFEPFQRGGDQRSTRGAGVGLALCRAIARAHGGDIQWHPRRAGGSRFEVRLPLEPQPSQPQPQETGEASS